MVQRINAYLHERQRKQDSKEPSEANTEAADNRASSSAHADSETPAEQQQQQQEEERKEEYQKQSAPAKTPCYLLNMDPAVQELPYEANIDIRDTINYKSVMTEYGLGPNGAIVTCLNLFATKFDQVSGQRSLAPGG